MSFDEHIREEEIIFHLLCEQALTEEKVNHLQGCEQCRRLSSGVNAVLNDLSHDPAHYPNPQHMWAFIEPRLKTRRLQSEINWRGWPWWTATLTAAMAAVVIVSVGRFTGWPVSHTSRRASEPIARTIEPIRSTTNRDALADADRVLTLLRHASDGVSPELRTDIQLQLSRNSIYVQRASEAGKGGEAKVLVDVDIVLMAANAADQNGAGELQNDAMTSQIRNVLTDVRLVEQELVPPSGRSVERN